MGSQYSQLNETEREVIGRLHAAGRSQEEIAHTLYRNKSTISRELRRNSRVTKRWPGGYDPKRAQMRAERRRYMGREHKLALQPALCALVRDGLAMGWSPAQIAGRLKRSHGATLISHESIYRFIYFRSDQKDYWHRLLPRAKRFRGRRGKRGGSPASFIRERVSIHARPPDIATRAQPGHWEADFMLFRKLNQSILVAHERASRFILICRTSNRTAQLVSDTLLERLRHLPDTLRRTITFDNGTEFAYHYQLIEPLGVRTFFCDPHAPWQKGGVENAIGRLRRSLPRKHDLDQLSPAQIEAAALRYNLTPRKCLAFRTPLEVYSSLIQTVALHP